MYRIMTIKTDTFTFQKAAITTWPEGKHGVPSGWLVISGD